MIMTLTDSDINYQLSDLRENNNSITLSNAKTSMCRWLLNFYLVPSTLVFVFISDGNSRQLISNIFLIPGFKIVLNQVLASLSHGVK